MTTTITIDLDPTPSRQRPSLFSSEMDTFLGKLPTWTIQVNAVAEEVNENTLTCAAAAIAADAEKWVSGTTYTEGDVVWSPLDYLTYRRKTDGAGSTDPSIDTTNWGQLAGLGDVLLNAIQTLTNKTIDLTDNTLSGTKAEFNTACSDGTFVFSGTLSEFNAHLTDDDFCSLTGTETVENKTIDLTDNTISGTKAEFNTACSDGTFVFSGTLSEFNNHLTDDDFCSLTGTETVENKTLKNAKEYSSSLSGTTPSIGIGAFTWALSGNSAPTLSLGDGGAVELHITNPSGYTMDWSAVDQWIGGASPNVPTSGTLVVVIWQLASTITGISSGVAS